MTTSVEEVAAILRNAAEQRVPCAPVRDMVDRPDITTAYAVQKHNRERALASGRRLVGRKIGLTSKSVQAQLKVDQPDFGALFADMAIVDGAEIAFDAVLQPRVEAEIAFVMARDLTRTGLTMADVAAAVAFVLPAIEIVGSRIAGWDIAIFDTIADNASSGAFVLGGAPVSIDRIDLRLCGMRLDHRGDPVATGCGAACLGNPLNAVLWLAERLIAEGERLSEGDVILSGALGPMVPVVPGGAYEATISGLGSVRAVFSEVAA
ncbi:MAG: fumarylacetoacetate hydrolase family protein [Sphingobium sp.]